MALPAAFWWCVLVAVLVGGLGALWLHGRWQAFLARRRGERGRAAEDQALTALRKRGFAIVEVQPQLQVSLLLDGEELAYGLRGDILAEKQGRRYLVEVKSGRRAPDPLHPETRRQLLEYALHFQVEALLLYDAEQDLLREVGFPALRERPQKPSGMGLWLFAGGLVLGLALGVIGGWLLR